MHGQRSVHALLPVEGDVNVWMGTPSCLNTKSLPVFLGTY